MHQRVSRRARRLVTCLSNLFQRGDDKFERGLHHLELASKIVRAAAISLWRGAEIFLAAEANCRFSQDGTA